MQKTLPLSSAWHGPAPGLNNSNCTIGHWASPGPTPPPASGEWPLSQEEGMEIKRLGHGLWAGRPAMEEGVGDREWCRGQGLEQGGGCRGQGNGVGDGRGRAQGGQHEPEWTTGSAA